MHSERKKRHYHEFHYLAQKKNIQKRGFNLNKWHIKLQISLLALTVISLNFLQLTSTDEITRRREAALRQHSFFQLRIHLRRGHGLVAMDKNGKLIVIYNHKTEKK